jgi:hypothetical protein
VLNAGACRTCKPDSPGDIENAELVDSLHRGFGNDVNRGNDGRIFVAFFVTFNSENE